MQFGLQTGGSLLGSAEWCMYRSAAWFGGYGMARLAVGARQNSKCRPPKFAGNVTRQNRKSPAKIETNSPKTYQNKGFCKNMPSKCRAPLPILAPAETAQCRAPISSRNADPDLEITLMGYPSLLLRTTSSHDHTTPRTVCVCHMLSTRIKRQPQTNLFFFARSLCCTQ